MSTQASFSVEDITAARGAPVWFQLYTTNQFEVTKKLVKRAESAGCPVVTVTVDLPAGRNMVTATRLRRALGARDFRWNDHRSRIGVSLDRERRGLRFPSRGRSDV